MSRTTSQGEATVRLLCETFRISRQAYYAAGSGKANPGLSAPPPERRSRWTLASELEPEIRELQQEPELGCAQNLGVPAPAGPRRLPPVNVVFDAPLGPDPGPGSRAVGGGGSGARGGRGIQPLLGDGSDHRLYVQEGGCVPDPGARLRGSLRPRLWCNPLEGVVGGPGPGHREFRLGVSTSRGGPDDLECHGPCQNRP